jgi:hypothetical protein
MNIFGPNWLGSSKSSLIAAISAGELFIALPFFVFFVTQQPRRGPFTALLALEVAVMSALAGGLWGLFMWFVFIEPYRKRRM